MALRTIETDLIHIGLEGYSLSLQLRPISEALC